MESLAVAPQKGLPTKRDFRCSAMIAGVVAVALLGACQTDGTSTPAMSLKEAKQVTATFEGGSFVPPPRTIADITAILDQQTLADPEEIARQEAEAEAQPPAGTSESKLAAFYYKRGMAARRLGRSGQELADLREAAGIALEGAVTGATLRREIFHQLAWAEFTLGNHITAILGQQTDSRDADYGERPVHQNLRQLGKD